MSAPYKKHVTIGDCELYLGDCLEVMLLLGGVNGVVTSPPYGTIRDYGGIDTRTEWLDVISHIAKLLTEGGFCMWNVADQTVDGSETGTSFRQALHAISCGLRLHDTMIYCKSGVTFPDANRYHPAFEYMFVFSKGAPKHFNGLRDWRNKWAGTPMHGTGRHKSNETKPINGYGNPIKQHGLRRNWWPISNPYTGETKGHPAPMPYSMASDHIETWSVEGQTILDPFMGSGTTGVACVNLGRKFTGIELDPDYFEIACERIREAYRQPRLFDEPAPKAKQEAMI